MPSRHIPIERVDFTVGRQPGELSVQVLNVNRQRSNHLGKLSPICRPKPIHSSSARNAHMKRPTRVQLPVLQPTNARLTPGRGAVLLTCHYSEVVTKDTPLEPIRCLPQGRYLHTNLSRHSSKYGRTPPETIPPHPNGIGGEPSARYSASPSTPAAESSNQSEQSSQSRLVP